MLRFRILGPVEVLHDGRSLPLGGPRQRAILAGLLVHANEVVAADRLIEDVWGDEAAETASHGLHVSVSRLRKTLADGGVDTLTTRAPGYLLRIEPPDELDATVFERGLRRATEAIADDPAEALRLVEEALSIWRGGALEEFADEPFARPTVARLEELRETAREMRVEALIANGRTEEAVAEVEELIVRFPLRERLRELQMLALYRWGRQAEALDAYQRARSTLADELGVDPSPTLVALEDAILRHDPALTAVHGSKRRASAAPTGRSRPRRVAGIVAVAALAITAVAVVALAVRTPDRGATTSSPTSGGEPPTQADLGAVRWSELQGSAFGGPGDQVILGADSSGGVAVGYSAPFRDDPDELRDYDAAVWIETATEWIRSDDPAFDAIGAQKATDVVILPERIVVVGTDASLGDHDVAVWLLDDGTDSWKRADLDALAGSDDAWLRDAIWTGSRIFAVGFSRQGGDEDVAIFSSDDGHAWSEVSPAQLREPGDQEMTSVTTSGDLVVAAGFSELDDRDAAIWTTTNGIDWDRVHSRDLSGEGDQQINAVIGTETRLVAVGHETVDGDEDAAVWVSRDGDRWRQLPDIGDVFGGPGAQRMSALAASPFGLVAAGTETDGRNADAALWSLSDGLWARTLGTDPNVTTFTDIGRQSIHTLIATSTGYLAFGSEGAGADTDADIWIGRWSAEPG